MTNRLHGKVALITGAGSIGPGVGNGKATSILFAREGASVFAVDIDLDTAKETVTLIENETGRGGSVQAVAHQADVTDAGQIENLVETAKETFGRIDILVNNVGIARTGGIISTEEADWDRVTEVNQKSVYLMCRAVVPIMQHQGGGAIVNIASVAAHRWTGINYASYYATKGAVIALTRGIALEFAKDGIRCNSVSPGLMNTPMVHHGLTSAYGAEGDIDNLVKQRDAQCPTGKMGTAWDTAHACLFLASDDAGYINAHDLVVDGGLIAKFV